MLESNLKIVVNFQFLSSLAKRQNAHDAQSLCILKVTVFASIYFIENTPQISFMERLVLRLLWWNSTWKIDKIERCLPEVIPVERADQ